MLQWDLLGSSQGNLLTFQILNVTLISKIKSLLRPGDRLKALEHRSRKRLTLVMESEERQGEAALLQVEAAAMVL